MKKGILFVLFVFSVLCKSYGVEPSGSLPVMYINTENGAAITSKTDYVNATYYLDPKGVEGVSAIGTADAPLPMKIRGRGNYTWNDFDKKPYRLKLDKKQKLMGMNSSKHWALLAHADDTKGFLRNAVGFQLSRLIGLPWTPGDAAIEVVLNGDYIGLYFLTETVRVDKTRVNVYDYDSGVEDAEDALADAQASGDAAAIASAQAALEEAKAAEPGWLLEIDNYDDEDQVQIDEGHGAEDVLRFTYDNPADYITEEHRTWLINEMTDINNRIYAGDYANCTWAEKIDLTDLAKFYIVNQLVDNYESFHGSCKLFKDNAAHSAEVGTDTKWHFSPVWDFGSAFNRSMQNRFYENGDGVHVWWNHWIAEMMKYSEFQDVVNKVYAEFINGNYSEIYGYIDNFATAIESAAAADLQRWPQYGNDNIAGHASDVKSKLRTSVKYLNSEFGNIDPDEPDDLPDRDLYFRGTINGWGAESAYRFSYQGKGIYTLDIAELSDYFKVADNTWGPYNFGGQVENDIVQLNVPYTLLSGTSNNLYIEGTVTDIVATFNWKDKTLTLTKQSDGVDLVYGTADATPIVRVTASGSLSVTVVSPTELVITRIDGTTSRVAVPAGTSTISLPYGFYIINGRKYFVR